MPTLPITVLGRVSATAATWTAINDDGHDLALGTVDGKVYIRIRTSAVNPGEVVTVATANMCSRGSAHDIAVTLASTASYDIPIPRGRFGPATVSVSTDAVGVYAYAYAVPSTLL